MKGMRGVGLAVFSAYERKRKALRGTLAENDDAFLREEQRRVALISSHHSPLCA